MNNKTCTIIKPDAVKAGHTGEILALLEKSGFQIERIEMFYLDRQQAAAFYAEHEGKPFYEKLIDFMSSGPCVAASLVKDNAIDDLRKVVGPTDPAEAPADSIRGRFGSGTPQNAIHASDSIESAAREFSFFFRSFAGTN